MTTLNAQKERAKRNIEKGFYNEASKDIQEALKIDSSDAEAKALHAKIKTLQ
jgi:Tfp pilus assembly protein PilF